MTYRCACAAVCVLLESLSLASAQESPPELLWFKRYDRGYTFAGWVKEVSDGGFVLAGSTGRGERQQAYLVRLDSSGDVLWDVAFGTVAYARSMDIAEDGFVLAGQARVCSPWDALSCQGSRFCRN